MLRQVKFDCARPDDSVPPIVDGTEESSRISALRGVFVLFKVETFDDGPFRSHRIQRVNESEC